MGAAQESKREPETIRSQRAGAPSPGTEAEDGLGTHGYARSGDVTLHYVTRGQGPLMVLIHGFPDYWYTWRQQMPAWSEGMQVIAIDQRGYNWSDAPTGVENYAMPKLVEDVRAVIEQMGRKQAVIVGHDWGGMVAWSFAMAHPEMTERLVILNLPHPNGLRRELANNPQQQANSAYARFFQQEDAARLVQPDKLIAWVKDPEARTKYAEAMKRSSIDGMLNYYKANYPREPYTMPTEPLPRIQCPVLIFHGLDDQALLAPALNDTWTWIDRECTLMTIPKSGHFVQQDAAETVTRVTLRWLSP